MARQMNRNETAIRVTFERVASINPSRITDQGSKKRVQPHVINIICLASDSALDGTFVRNERLTIRVPIRTSPRISDHCRNKGISVLYINSIRSLNLPLMSTENPNSRGGGGRQISRENLIRCRSIEHRCLQSLIIFPGRIPRGNRIDASEPHDWIL